MRNLRKYGLGAASLILLAGTCLGQTPAEPAKFYRLQFEVKELEGGKVLNTRSYVTTLAVDGQAQIRTGGRVPTQAPGGGVTYLDLGINIDCSKAREMGGDLSLYVNVDISSALMEPQAPGPVIRQNKWSSTAIVPLKKPTVIFSSDDTTGKRQMQLELTATPIK